MTKKRITTGLVLLIISFIIVSATQFCTTPFLNITAGTDAMAFWTIGKGWFMGKIPYIGLWDSKGPLIFFINFLGYALTKSKISIFIFEIIAWFFTALFTLKILDIGFTRKKSMIFTAIVVFSGSFFCSYYGNNVEDYCLPFLTWSMLLLMKYFNQNEKAHKPSEAFVYGITFAVCLLTRVTNAIPVCTGGLIISIMLIVNKQWSNLFKNAGMFILGVAVLCAPFAIYYAAKGHLYDLVYGTLLYNFHYAVNTSPYFISEGIMLYVNLVRVSILLFGSLVIFFIGIMIVAKDRKFLWKGIFYILLSVITTVYFLTSNLYNHYMIITVPYIAVDFIELKRLRDTVGVSWKKNVLKPIFVLFLVANSVLAVVSTAKNIYCGCNYDRYMFEFNSPVINIIPEEDKDSFVAYNVDACVYEKMNCLPCYKFFAYQDWAETRDEKLIGELRDVYSTCKAKWILIREKENSLISDILDENYELISVDKEKGYQLYKLNSKNT